MVGGNRLMEKELAEPGPASGVGGAKGLTCAGLIGLTISLEISDMQLGS